MINRSSHSPVSIDTQPPRLQRVVQGREQGMATVEFAIVGAVLILLVIGTMQLGLAIYFRNHVANVATEATRYAAVRGSTSQTPATTSSIKNFVLSRSSGLVDNSKLTVATTWVPDNKTNSIVRVQITYPYPLTIPFIPKQVLTLKSTSEMVIF